MQARRVVRIAAVSVAALVLAGCDHDDTYHTPEPGKITVVRGAPGDDRNSETRDTRIREVMCPDSDQKNLGRDVAVHSYHEKRSQRYYLIDEDPNRGDRPTVDFIETETADGVQVKIEAKFYFHTNFDCSGEGEKLVREFDTQYGSRSFPVPGGGGDSDDDPRPWEGANGWGAFLDINVRPEIDDTVSTLVKSYTCGDLNPACAALSRVQSGRVLADANQGKRTAARKTELEDRIVEQLNEVLREAMGAEYLTFTDVKVVVNLPENVQASLEESQAKYAALSGKQAELQAAALEARRQRLLARTFTNSPAALKLEMLRLQNEGLKNLPEGASVYYGVEPVR